MNLQDIEIGRRRAVARAPRGHILQRERKITCTKSVYYWRLLFVYVISKIRATYGQIKSLLFRKRFITGESASRLAHIFNALFRYSTY
jgi:hypothetical protein